MDEPRYEAHLHGLQKHLQDVAANPRISDLWRMTLLNQLSELLPALQQDPTPAADLVGALIRPESFDFKKVLSIQPKVNFVTGLCAPSPPINMVTLDLLRKASSNSSDVGIVAGMPDVVKSLIKIWLCTEDVAVHQRAHSLLEDFLIGPHGSELMWRRLLVDKDIYGSIFEICRPLRLLKDGQTGSRDRTIAQGRLLALVAKVDCLSIRISQYPEIEQQYGVDCLLDFAVLVMVDYEADLLMHMTLIQFFSDWLCESSKAASTANSQLPSSEAITSPALDYLIGKGLHSRTISYFTQASSRDSLNDRNLYSQAAGYLQTYFSYYPDHALGPGRETLKSAFARISDVLDRTSPGTFVGSPPYIELGVLASAPRVALLARDFASPSLLKLPIQPPSAAVFTTLANLFSGSGQQGSGKAASRILYFLYLKQRSDLWSTTIKAAETIALKDAAVAAGRLVFCLVTADWGPFEDLLSSSQLDESMFRLRSEESFANSMGARDLPLNGFLAILTSPALESIMPWLLQPAQKSSNLGVGGKGDVEGAANSVAQVKYDALQSLHGRLQEYTMAHGTNAEWQSILAQMGKRLAQGRWGGSTGVGGRIATTER
ncbi:MAG: hypothetical protein Q9191_003685 [Dirinaria sp. TL-2023a]